MLGMGSGKSPRVSLRSKLQLYCDCVTVAGGNSLRPGAWHMLNFRLSLRIQESRPAAQSLTEKEEPVFEVTDVCTSWSLDFASDLFWYQAKPRTQLENHSVPGISEAIL